MALTDVFSRVAAALFSGKAAAPRDDIDAGLVKDAVEAIVEAVEPKIRLVPRYRARLEPVVVRAIRALRALAPAVPEPVELSREAWSTVPTINAFFATANDVSALLGGTRELRAFFDDPANALHDAAYCALVTRREERRVLASAMVDGVLRADVVQTTLSFTGHRLVAPTADPTTARRQVGQAILQRVASLALERIVAMRERATELDSRKGMLEARLRMLTLRRSGLHELAPDEKDPAAEIAAIERELEATVADRKEVKASLATLDTSIEQIERVLGAPEESFGMNPIELHVDHRGFILAAGSQDAGSALRLNELWIGPNLRGVIAMVRVPRTALPPKQDRLADAARYLA